MNMKDMIQKMTNIESEEKSKKQELTEAASMNISMSADDAGQVGQLMSMMRNAGMDAKPVGGDMPMPMRHDIEKFRQAVDNPDIPGKDDVPGDMDLKAGVIGTLGGGVAGAKGADMLDKATGGVASDMAAQSGGALGKAIGALGGPAGAIAGDAIGRVAGKMLPKAAGAVAGGAVGDKITGEADGDYANSPDEQYRPYSDMTKGGTDLNKSKKTYPKVAGGDNPMAAKIKEELASLYKEYKA